MIQSSADGNQFGEARVFIEASGVPSAVCHPDGRLLVTFQWFPLDNAEHFDKVAVVISKDDGLTWSAPVPIVIEGMPSSYTRAFDPTLAVTEDGGIRVYFSSDPSGKRTMSPNIGTHSALSRDGIHYQFETGARLSVPGDRVIDPAVWKLRDTWHLTAPISTTPLSGAYHAVSADGLHFQRVADIPSVNRENWTGNLVGYGRGMRFYGGGRDGIWWSYTEDGRTWTSPTTAGIAGGDPTVLRTGAGDYIIISVGDEIHSDRKRPGGDRPGAEEPKR